MRTTSAIAAAALGALGLTGLASAMPGTDRPGPVPARAVERVGERVAGTVAASACTPAVWPYASTCGTAAPVRIVRVIAVDAIPTGPGRR